MIRANIEAAIDVKQKRRDQIYEDLRKLDNVIDNLKDKKYKLLDEDNDLYFEIEGLKESLTDEL